MFPQLKSVLKGWCFCDATDLIKGRAEKAFIKCLPGMFPTPVRYAGRKCIVEQGDYFEGNVT